MKELDITSELRRISSMGLVRTMRPGDTGIGYTLETLLGLRETNRSGVEDFTHGGVPCELKAQRAGSTAMVTLFTGEADEREFNDVEMIRRYGYVNGQGRPALKVTLTGLRFVPQGLKLTMNWGRKSVTIEDRKGLQPWSWNFGRFRLKIGRMVVVQASTRGSGESEAFHYNSALLLEGLDEECFFHLIENGDVTVDLRVHLREDGSARNHGTAFRIKKLERLAGCYRSVTQIL